MGGIPLPVGGVAPGVAEGVVVVPDVEVVVAGAGPGDLPMRMAPIRNTMNATTLTYQPTDGPQFSETLEPPP